MKPNKKSTNPVLIDLTNPAGVLKAIMEMADHGHISVHKISTDKNPEEILQSLRDAECKEFSSMDELFDYLKSKFSDKHEAEEPESSDDCKSDGCDCNICDSYKCESDEHDENETDGEENNAEDTHDCEHCFLAPFCPNCSYDNEDEDDDEDDDDDDDDLSGALHSCNVCMEQSNSIRNDIHKVYNNLKNHMEYYFDKSSKKAAKKAAKKTAKKLRNMLNNDLEHIKIMLNKQSSDTNNHIYTMTERIENVIREESIRLENVITAAITSAITNSKDASIDPNTGKVVDNNSVSNKGQKGKSSKNSK